MVMEEWEKELREKLQKELPEGPYQIGVPPMMAYTGKGGRIEFEVALHKQMMKLAEELKSK
jgi:hypothetical protein